MKGAPRQGCSSVNIERMFDLDSEEARFRRMHSDTAVEQVWRVSIHSDVP